MHKSKVGRTRENWQIYNSNRRLNSKLNRPEVSKNTNSTMNSLDLLDIPWTSSPTKNIFLNVEGTFIKVDHRNCIQYP